MTEHGDYDVEALLAAVAASLRPLAAAERAPVMIGVQTGGAWVAERLHRALGLTAPLGRLNITFYRDDFTRIGLHPRIGPSDIPTPIEDRTVILVDDVLHTGRTVRAAMNEIFDYGRPAAIRLAVLVDRGGRELPIAADVIGTTVEIPDAREIKLIGPEPLALVQR